MNERALPWRLWTVAGLVLLASWLRFSGLSWGLRHPVHLDERYYVENTVEMVRAGDLNHRYYNYPGLFFYMLAPGIALLGPARMGGPDAYLVSRGLVAAIGVLNVALLYLVGRRLVGPWAGFTAALLLAVLPVDILTSHQVRPEIPLTTAAILALAAFRRVGEGARGDVLSGLAMGAGTAIKYSAPFLFPSYLLTRLLTPGRRLRGAAIAAALLVAVPVVCTPYALLRPRQYSGGPRALLLAYYAGRSNYGDSNFLGHVAYYLRDAWTALGWVAATLALLGIVLSLRRSWRIWGPLLVHPVVTVVVMATAALVYPRQILQAMPLLCLMAGVAVQAAASRSRAAGVALCLAAAVLPWRSSLSYVEAIRRPSSEDLGLDWIEAHLPSGARILETRPEAAVGGRAGAAIGLDRKKYEISYYLADGGPDRKRDLGLLAPHMDLIITGLEGGGSWAADLATVYRAPDDFEFKAPSHPLRCVPVGLDEARWSASEDATSLPPRGGAPWRTSGPMAGGEWIQLELKEPSPVGRIEVVLGNAPGRHPPDLQVALAGADGRYEDVDSVNARPEVRELVALGRPGSLWLALAPRPALGVRIRQVHRGDLPWTVSAIRLEACRAQGFATR